MELEIKMDSAENSESSSTLSSSSVETFEEFVYDLGGIFSYLISKN